MRPKYIKTAYGYAVDIAYELFVSVAALTYGRKDRAKVSWQVAKEYSKSLIECLHLAFSK